MSRGTLNHNKGEWSELYAFSRLLKDGAIYAADENTNRIEDMYLPIIKLIREEFEGKPVEYFTGEVIEVIADNIKIATIEAKELAKEIDILLGKIFDGGATKGAFEISGVETFMDKIHITKVKAPSKDKADIVMQIHDVHTGYKPTVGFSIKSDVGSPPTLLNSGKNTRIRYSIEGLSDELTEKINALNKDNCKNYIKERMSLLFANSTVKFNQIKDNTFNDNLIMIDSLMPQLFGELVCMHYKHINDGVYDCKKLIELVSKDNALRYRSPEVYSYKFKKLITASALGMTPGKIWNGRDAATGGYIIIKKDGDVVCYHLYNRNFFEDYLLKNTRFDRPSADRHDYGYVYSENNKKYIDLNVQIRFN